jgi:hypothetical protein
MEVIVSIATLLPDRAGRSPASALYPSTAFESALSDLIRKVFVGADGCGYQIVAFTSPTPEKDLSLLCASLGCKLGQMHGPVLVISAQDLLRKRTDMREIREVDFAKVGDNPIWVVPRDRSGIPRELADEATLSVMMTNLKRQFDFIVVDAGSTSAVCKAHGLLSCVDGFVLVTTEGRTEVQQISNLRKYLDKNGARAIGGIYIETSRNGR